MSDIILSNKYKRLLFLSFFVIAIVLRIIYLDKSLCGDEINSVLGAKQNINNLFSFIAKNDSYPPLQHILLHFWLQLGDSEVWIRSLYLIFGIGVCLMTYLIGKAYINSKFGLYSLFFVSISPQLIQLSQYVRGIIISAFFISVSIYFLMRILAGKINLLNWIFYSLSSICALYSFYFAVLILIAENVYIILNWKEVKNISKKWIISQLLIIGSFILWLPFFVIQLLQANIADNTVASVHKGFFIWNFHVGSLVRSMLGTFGLDQLFLTNIAVSRIWPIPFLVIITMICFYIFLMIIFRATYFFRKFTYASKISCWFFQSLVIIPIILTMILRHINNFPVVSRYFAPLNVFFIFIIIGAIFSFNNKKLRKFLFIVLTVLFIIRIPGIYSPIEQWREAVSYIQKESDSKDCIIFLEKGRDDFNYYSKRNLPQFIIVKYITRDRKSFNLLSIDSQNSKRLINLLSPYNRLWVILTHTKVFGGTDILERWFLENEFRKEEENKFIGVDVVLYVRK